VHNFFLMSSARDGHDFFLAPPAGGVWLLPRAAGQGGVRLLLPHVADQGGTWLLLLRIIGGARLLPHAADQGGYDFFFLTSLSLEGHDFFHALPVMEGCGFFFLASLAREGRDFFIVPSAREGTAVSSRCRPGTGATASSSRHQWGRDASEN
jgi:hypothetical protein